MPESDYLRGRGRGSSLRSPLTPEEIDAAANALLAEVQGQGTTAASQAGFLRGAWDVATGPVRALAGVTGTPLAQALRLAMPDQYTKVAAELEEIEKNKYGIDAFETAAALPGAGDVLTADWDPESVGGRVGKTVTTLGANILGDPTSYVGVGIIPKIAKLIGGSRIGKAAKGLGGTRAMKTAAKIEKMGDLGEVGRAVDAGDPMRAARAFPFSPLVGVPYLPEIAESTATGLGESWEELKAGRYANAAASGAGAMLTGGLGALVAKGTITEAVAARVLKRGLKDQVEPAAAAEEEVAATSPQMPPPPPEGLSSAPFAPEGTPLESPTLTPPDAGGGVAPPPTIYRDPKTGEVFTLEGSVLKGDSGSVRSAGLTMGLEPVAAAPAAAAAPPPTGPPTPAVVEAAAAAAPPARVWSPKAQAILDLADAGQLVGDGARERWMTALGLTPKRQKGKGDSFGDNLKRDPPLGLGDEEATALMGELSVVRGRGYGRRVKEEAAAPVVSNNQAPTPSRGQAPTAAAAAPATVAQVPSQITHQQIAKLKHLGYDDDAIGQMPFTDVQRIIADDAAVEKTRVETMKAKRAKPAKGRVDAELAKPGNREAALSELDDVAQRMTQSKRVEDVDKRHIAAYVLETRPIREGESPEDHAARQSDDRAILYRVNEQGKKARRDAAAQEQDLEPALRASLRDGGKAVDDADADPAASLLDDQGQGPSASLRSEGPFTRTVNRDGKLVTEQLAMPGEAPIPAGHIRVYRGQTKPKYDKGKASPSSEMSERGRWFTSSRRGAMNYADNNPKRHDLLYVDIPRELAEDLKDDDYIFDSTFVLPKELMSKVQRVEEPTDRGGPSASLTRIGDDDPNAPVNITPNLLAKAKAEALANPPVIEDTKGEGAGKFKTRPPGTPKDLVPKGRVEDLGLTATRGEPPTGIGPKVGLRPEPERPILTRAEYDQARADLAKIRDLVASDKITSDAQRLELAEEFADDDALLVDRINQAIKAGIHTQPMVEPTKDLAPERPEPYTGPREVIKGSTRDLKMGDSWDEDGKPIKALVGTMAKTNVTGRVQDPNPGPRGAAFRSENLSEQEHAARAEESRERGKGGATYTLTEDALAARIADLRKEMAGGATTRPNRGPGPRSGLGRRLPGPPEKMDDRVRSYYTAILSRGKEQGLTPDDITDRVRDIFDVDDISDLAPEQLSILFSAMDGKDLRFRESLHGVRATTNRKLSPLEERQRIKEKTMGPEYALLPDRLHPPLGSEIARNIVETAYRRLTGVESYEDSSVARHIVRLEEERKAAGAVEKEEGREGSRDRPPIQFQYDPRSAAGIIQSEMRNVQRSGHEDDLQETTLRWARNLTYDDARHLADAEASIRNYEFYRNRTHTKAGNLTAWGEIKESGDLADELAYNEATLAVVKKKRARGQKNYDSARNLRLLLTNPQALDLEIPKGSNLDAVVTTHLAKLLRKDIARRIASYFEKDDDGNAVGYGARMRGRSPTEIEGAAGDLISRTEEADLNADSLVEGDSASYMRGGLNDEESARLSDQSIEEASGLDVDPTKVYDKVNIPARPAATPPAQWLREVANNPEKRDAILESLYVIAKAPKAKQGASHPYKNELRQIEQDLGLKSSSTNVEARAITAAQAVRDAHNGGPSASSKLLSHQVVDQRRAQWEAAILKGTTIGNTNTRVVDFEGDVAGITTKEVAALTAPLATRLALAVANFANILGIRTRFGGIVISPQLNGVHMHDDAGTIFVNPLHARRDAEAAVAKEGVTGPAAERMIARATAANIVDTIAHELAHNAARHSDRVGDMAFRKAYRQYLDDLGPHYGELIRELRDILPKTDSLTARYEAAVDTVVTRKQEARNVSRKGDVAGAGKGGAAAGGDRSGGGARSPDGGAGGRVQPGRAVPGRDPQPSAGARAATPADEGVVAAGAEGAGRAGGDVGGGSRVGDDADATGPSASLTDITDSLVDQFDDMRNNHRMRQHMETAQDVNRRFAAQMAKHAGGKPNRKLAASYLRDLQALRVVSPEVRAALADAGPGRAADAGRRLGRFADEAMSEEQREHVGLLLRVYNHAQTRAERMTWEQVQEATKKLLETNNIDEFVDKAALRGLNSPADWAFFDGILGMMMKEVDKATLKVRQAKVELETSQLIGKGVKEAEQAFEDAMGVLAHAEMRKRQAIFISIPQSTNVARMLAFMKGTVTPLTAGETFKNRFKGMLQVSGIKKEKQEEFYRMLMDTLSGKAEPDEFTRAFRQAIQPKWFDKFIEFWKAGLLGLPTQIVNITSGAVHLALTNVEKSTASLANVYFSSITGAPRTRFISETSARAMGGKFGLAEAWQSLSADLKEIAALRPPDLAKKYEMGTFYDDPNLRQHFGAIGGKWGEFVRIPFKLLDAFDSFFKYIIRNQEWAAQADRLAYDERFWSHPNEGTTHATSRIYAELRALAHDPLGHHALWMKKDPKSGAYVYRNAVKAGRDMAILDTFQESLVGSPLRKTAGAWDKAVNEMPALQLVTPFRKTPYNIIAEALKRTPMAGLWAIKQWNAGKIDDPAMVEAVIRSAIGTAIMAYVFGEALDGTITGSGPSDPKEAELLKRTGWQPRSIKIGDQYWSYSRFAPFSIQLGLAADMADAYKNKDVTTGGEIFEKGIQSASANITDQSFLTGIDNLMKLLTDPKRQGATVARQFQASLVPNVIGVVPFGHAARAIDPIYRETEALTMSPFLAQTPFLSKTLQPQYSATGEPRQRPGTAGERLLSPITRTPVKTDPIAMASGEIARVGPSLESPPLFYRVGTDKVYYSPQERDEIGRAQQKALQQVAVLMRSASYQRLPDTLDVANVNDKTKKMAIEEILNRYRRPVVTRINKVALQRAQRAGPTT